MNKRGWIFFIDDDERHTTTVQQADRHHTSESEAKRETLAKPIFRKIEQIQQRSLKKMRENRNRQGELTK